MTDHQPPTIFFADDRWAEIDAVMRRCAKDKDRYWRKAAAEELGIELKVVCNRASQLGLVWTGGKKKRKKKFDSRTCLKCDRDFMSEGIYNRICPNCREGNSYIVDANMGDKGRWVRHRGGEH